MSIEGLLIAGLYLWVILMNWMTRQQLNEIEGLVRRRETARRAIRVPALWEDEDELAQ